MPSQSLLHGQGLTIGWARTSVRRFSKRWSRSLWRVAWVMSLVALTGCAAATPAALTTQHPAHPEATMAPDLPPSTTLAYTPADIPSARPAVATAPRGGERASPSQQRARTPSSGRGRSSRWCRRVAKSC